MDSQEKLENFSKSLSPFIGVHDYFQWDYNLKIVEKVNKSVSFRDFRHCDHQALAEMLRTKLILANPSKAISDPNELVDYFSYSVIDSLDLFALINKRTLKRQASPWITYELKPDLHARDALYKRARRTGNSHLLTLFKIKRRELKIKLNNRRDEYLRNVLEDKSQGTKIWTELKRLGIIKGKKSSPLDHFDANKLNSFYANTLTRYPSCTREFIGDLLLHHAKVVNCSFSRSHIDIVDVTKSLKLTLHKSKGKSPDGLDLRWLRDHLSQISFFLMTIFDCSLNK